MILHWFVMYAFKNLNKIVQKKDKKYRNYHDKYLNQEINRNFEIDDFGFLIGQLLTQ